MSRAEIIEFLSEFLKKEVLAPGVELTEKTSFSNLGMDSYSIINLLLALEEKSGKSLIENGIRSEDIESMESLVAFVLSRT
jgi:acyl carrier protein